MVSLVLVSHSRALAEALMNLVKQMASQDLRVAIAAGAGPDRQEFGTDASEIASVIQSIYSPDGVLVLMDLGSAVLSAEMAVELLPQEMQTHIACCAAPLVEGAIAAGVQAGLGSDLETVCWEAQRAMAPKVEHLDESQPGTRIEADARKLPIQGETRAMTLVLQNLHGLHARPAARFVQVAAAYQADIQVTNASSGKGPVSAKSLNALAMLGVSRGDRITITANGREAALALEALRRLVLDNFGAGAIQEIAQLAAPTAFQVTKPLSGEAIQGIPVSEGIVLGQAYHYQPVLLSIPEDHSEHPEEEWECLQLALENTRLAIQRRRIRLSAQLGEAQAAIFDAHVLILQDPLLLDKVRERIFIQGENAAYAWQASINEVAVAYRNLADPYQQARNVDVIDVGKQVLREIGLQTTSPAPSLRSGQGSRLRLEVTSDAQIEFTSPAILFAEELIPTEIAQLDLRRVLGLVTVRGGSTAHSAILARALGIPAVSGIDLSPLEVKDDTLVALDGFSGELWVEPAPKVQQQLAEKRLEWLERRARLLQSSHEPACTRDGRRVEVAANVGSLAAAQAAVDNGAEGIGVLRTEFLYLDRRTPPSEDEQLATLRVIGQVMGERPVIVRTLDVGGDKELPYLDRPPEANPYLGVRGLRLSLRNPGLFLTQLRAILRAGADSPVRVMFPMVAAQDEILQAGGLLEQVHQELEKEKIRHCWPVEMGIMVEVPSAALLSSTLAPLVDFFSVGTNDLSQYTLAAERGNPDLGIFADALHPAVLRLIQQVVEAAHQHGKWAGVCGEVAGDPLAVPVLIGLGVDELSMNPAEIPQVKAVLRQIDMASVRRVAEKALKCESAAVVRRLAREFKDEKLKEGN
ncbi:MAG TPA: phosphoenolpyruvate--protein phosphotransferase [Anaerolineales bacterium]|nr:phosphoenolpyruvate--protein phosphotransferase [Anaerolineales bacterium]